MSLLQQYRAKLYEHEKAVRQLRREGKCDGSMRPDCYERCEHGGFCSEMEPRYNQLLAKRRRI